MAKKKKLSPWNPDSARRSGKVAVEGSQTDLNSAKNSGKVLPIERDEGVIADDFGMDKAKNFNIKNYEEFKRIFNKS